MIELGIGTLRIRKEGEKLAISMVRGQVSRGDKQKVKDTRGYLAAYKEALAKGLHLPEADEFFGHDRMKRRVKKLVKDTVVNTFLPAAAIASFAILGENVINSAISGNIDVKELIRVDPTQAAQAVGLALIGLSRTLGRNTPETEIRQKWPVVTVGLIALNSLALLAHRDPQLLDATAHLPVVNSFLHEDVAGHFFPNMFALALLGSDVERRIGSKKTLLAYVLGGLAADKASSALHIGASGNILGLLGVDIAQAAADKDVSRIPPLAAAVGLILGPGSKDQLIDQASHVGGFLGGLSIGGAFAALKELPKHVWVRQDTSHKNLPRI